MFETGEEMIFCPYNRFHVVKKMRIQKHILKCKKNHPEIKLATCIYNYSHKLKPEDLLKHYEICRHKVRLDDARYYGLNDFSHVSSVRSERQNVPFPDNLKACVSREPKVISLMDYPDSKQLNSSSSDCEMSQHKSEFQSPFSSGTHSNDSDDDLDPLPLPKTVSKAFVCAQSESKKLVTPETSKPKGYGRGRNFVLLSPPKPQQRIDHMLPDLSNLKSDTVKQNKSSIPFLQSIFSKTDDGICGQSVTSSMFDDVTTLKSVDISIDDVIDVEDIILKDLDKYVKL